MSDITTTESILNRDRLIVVSALALVCFLCWGWLLSGAGTGMSIGNMSTWQFPPPVEIGGPIARWSAVYWGLMLMMWWTMMIAMMVPSAAPMILLYARVVRRAQSDHHGRGSIAPTGYFAFGYLLSWLVFSLIATAMQWGLEILGLVHAMTMWSTSNILSAALLIAAGLYQFSPVKRNCLEHCRSPAEYLSRNWLDGSFGALRMGLTHGLYCVGCCYFLMALLFVGGAMNLIWIGGLAVYILVEKLAPIGQWVGQITGLALVATGVALLLV